MTKHARVLLTGCSHGEDASDGEDRGECTHLESGGVLVVVALLL